MRRLIILVTFLCSGSLYAQHEHTLHFMPNIGQFTYTNPALRPNFKVTLGLPGISSNYVSLANTGFKYKDIVRLNEEDTTLHLMLNNLPGKLSDRNYVQANASIDLFHLTFKANPRLFLSFNVTARSYKRLMYPRDMFDFIIKGNGNLLGKTLNLSPKMESASYVEIGLGGSYMVNRKLHVGARFKILRGIENATTRQSDLQITTDAENYNITVQAGVSVLTSNINRLTNEEIDYSKALDYMKNPGYSMDLGATYDFTERLSVALSILDIGTISWEDDTREYFMNAEQAKYTLAGAEIKDLLQDGSGPFQAAADSIEANFELIDRESKAYCTTLPAKAYLSGRYKLSPTVTTGAVIFMENFRDRRNGGFSVNVAKEIGSRMAASLSYSIMNRSYENAGAGLSFDFAPLQLYFVSDNLLNAAYHGITKGVLNDYVNNVKSVNLRFGMNIVFGRVKGPSSQFSK